MMDSAAVARGEENVSKPDEMAHLVETIYRGKLVDETASRELVGDLQNKLTGFAGDLLDHIEFVRLYTGPVRVD